MLIRLDFISHVTDQTLFQTYFLREQKTIKKDVSDLDADKRVLGQISLMTFTEEIKHVDSVCGSEPIGRLLLTVQSKGFIDKPETAACPMKSVSTLKTPPAAGF